MLLLTYMFFLFLSTFRYDTSNDGFLDLLELKYMMEKLQAPQTHLGLKSMIAEIDEDNDGKISFKEFLLIFKYVQNCCQMHLCFVGN